MTNKVTWANQTEEDLHSPLGNTRIDMQQKIPIHLATNFNGPLPPNLTNNNNQLQAINPSVKTRDNHTPYVNGLPHIENLNNIISQETNVNATYTGQIFEHSQNGCESNSRDDYLQTVLKAPKSNLPFGDLLSTPKTPGMIRIFFQNINIIYKFKSWESFSTATKHMSQSSIDIFGLAETNIKWNYGFKNKTKSIIQKHYAAVQITTACNDEHCLTSYQPGGTLTAITSKYTGRVLKPINDDLQMGRWSGFTLSTNFNTNLHILTVYQSVLSEGIHSSYKQQESKLLDLGFQNPNPTAKLLADLQELVKAWNKKGDSTIILIDANDNIYKKGSLPAHEAPYVLTTFLAVSRYWNM
jgi:hypothetical protein